MSGILSLTCTLENFLKFGACSSDNLAIAAHRLALFLKISPVSCQDMKDGQFGTGVAHPLECRSIECSTNLRNEALNLHEKRMIKIRLYIGLQRKIHHEGVFIRICYSATMSSNKSDDKLKIDQLLTGHRKSKLLSGI